MILFESPIPFSSPKLPFLILSLLFLMHKSCLLDFTLPLSLELHECFLLLILVLSLLLEDGLLAELLLHMHLLVHQLDVVAALLALFSPAAAQLDVVVEL